MPDNALDHLIKRLAALPGLGNRSARRIALHLLQKRDTVMRPLTEILQTAADEIRQCNECGNFDVSDPCAICRDERRDRTAICVLAQVSDVWAVERTGAYKGLYHVLGGVLSALDGIGPEDLNIRGLLERARNPECREIILALSATVDGQSTAHYLSDKLKETDVKITYLAHGMPVGGELDYLDDGTITTALNARRLAGS